MTLTVRLASTLLLASLAAPASAVPRSASLPPPESSQALPDENPSPDCVLPGDSRCEEWVGRHDVGTFESIADIAASPTGDRVFAVGLNAPSPTPGNDIVTVAFDASNGSVLWTDRYNGPGSIQDFAQAIEVTPDGRTVIAAGTRDDVGITANRDDLVAVGYDAATGERRWVASFDSGRYDFTQDLAIAPDGSRFYLTALTRGTLGSPDMDYLTVGFDAATGETLWSARENSPNVGAGPDYANAVAVSPDGDTVAVTGMWVIPASPQNTLTYGTVAYEAGDEERLGQRRWFTQHEIGVAKALAFSPDGKRVHVAGEVVRPNGTVWDYGLVAFDTQTGQRLWADRFNGCVNSCYLTSLAINPSNGDVYATGWALVLKDPLGVSGSQTDLFTLAYRGDTGERRWLSQYDSLGLNQVFPEAFLAPDQSALVLAAATQTSNRTFSTAVALDPATGEVRWEARHMPPGHIPMGNATNGYGAISPNRLFIARAVADDPADSSNGKYVMTAYRL